MAISKKERKKILKNQAIDAQDIFRFRWRIAQILCEMPPTWGGLTDVDLIMESCSSAYSNDELKQDFLKGKPRNFYKELIDEVMEDLVNRNIAEKEEWALPYGDIDMYRYRKGRSLNQKRCDEVLRIQRGDQGLFNKLFPLIK
jgi:hypothetical protein